MEIRWPTPYWEAENRRSLGRRSVALKVAKRPWSLFADALDPATPDAVSAAAKQPEDAKRILGVPWPAHAGKALKTTSALIFNRRWVYRQHPDLTSINRRQIICSSKSSTTTIHQLA